MTTLHSAPVKTAPDAPSPAQVAAAYLASCGLERGDVPSLLLTPPAASALEAAMADTLVASTLEAFAQPWMR